MTNNIISNSNFSNYGLLFELISFVVSNFYANMACQVSAAQVKETNFSIRRGRHNIARTPRH